MSKKVVVIALITLLIDQISKGIVDTFINLGNSIKIIRNFFYLTNVHNEGVAWGMLANKTLLIVILSIMALVIMYSYLYTFKKNNRNHLAFGLLFGGILGNLIDRIFIGYVRDFLDFYIGSYNFPVFNISDISIVIGSGLLILAILKGEDSSGNHSKRRKTKAR